MKFDTFMVPDWVTYLTWRPAFIGVMDPRYYTPDWLDRQVLNGTARMWANDKAAIIAELRDYPGGATDVHGLVAAGDLEAIVELIPLAEQWGRENGAIAGVIESREGWARPMRAHGYELYQTTLRKELCHGA